MSKKQKKQAAVVKPGRRNQMITIELSRAGGCGSATAYAVDFSRDVAVEMFRIPWNETGINTIQSEAVALHTAEALCADFDDAEVGSVPNHFTIISLQAAIAALWEFADIRQELLSDSDYAPKASAAHALAMA